MSYNYTCYSTGKLLNANGNGLIESDSDSDDDTVYDSENDESFLETTKIKVLVQKREELCDAIKKAAEEVRTSDAQLAMLKLYGDSIGKERPTVNVLSDLLSAYKVRMFDTIVLFHPVNWYSGWLFFSIINFVEEPSISTEAFAIHVCYPSCFCNLASSLKSSPGIVFRERFSCLDRIKGPRL